MTSLRRFTCHDLFSFNNINLDYFTETVRHQACWQICKLQLRPGLRLMPKSSEFEGKLANRLAPTSIAHLPVSRLPETKAGWLSLFLLSCPASSTYTLANLTTYLFWRFTSVSLSHCGCSQAGLPTHCVVFW